jgi:hypothetical protein
MMIRSLLKTVCGAVILVFGSLAFTGGSGPANCKTCASFPCIFGPEHWAYLDAEGTRGGAPHNDCQGGTAEGCPHPACSTAMLEGHSWQDVIGVFASSNDPEKNAGDLLNSFPKLAFYDSGRGGVQISSCSGGGVVGYIPLPRPHLADAEHIMPSNAVRTGA